MQNLSKQSWDNDSIQLFELFFDFLLGFQNSFLVMTSLENGAGVNDDYNDPPARILASSSYYYQIRKFLKKLILIMDPKSLADTTSTCLSFSFLIKVIDSIIGQNDSSLLSLIIDRNNSILNSDDSYLLTALKRNAADCFKVLLAKGHPKLTKNKIYTSYFAMLQKGFFHFRFHLLKFKGKSEPIEWQHQFSSSFVPEYADITFCFPAENVTIPGHKCIIGARSQYMLNLINTNPNGLIEIKEMTSDLFKIFLEFFYSGTKKTTFLCLNKGNISITLENVFSLALLSQQLKIQDITNMCESYLTLLISVDNFSKLEMKQIVDIYVTLPFINGVQIACEKYFHLNRDILATISDPR